MKNLIRKIVFKIRIWYPPSWFVNPFFSPCLYTEYLFRNVGKDFIDGFNEITKRLAKHETEA